MVTVGSGEWAPVGKMDSMSRQFVTCLRPNGFGLGDSVIKLKRYNRHARPWVELTSLTSLSSRSLFSGNLRNQGFYVRHTGSGKAGCDVCITVDDHPDLLRAAASRKGWNATLTIGSAVIKISNRVLEIVSMIFILFPIPQQWLLASRFGPEPSDANHSR